jgi:hypothetical protein
MIQTHDSILNTTVDVHQSQINNQKGAARRYTRGLYWIGLVQKLVVAFQRKINVETVGKQK